MKIVVLLILHITAISLLFGCGPGENKDVNGLVVEEEYEQKTPDVIQEEKSQDVDKPDLLPEEVIPIIWSKLGSELTGEYTIDQFDIMTSGAKYVGNGKWEFNVKGSGEGKTSLPMETVEVSDVYWVDTWKKEVTSYDLNLIAEYREKSNSLEIKTIEKSEVESTIQKVNENERHAKVAIRNQRWDVKSVSDNETKYIFSGTIWNEGGIPLYGVEIVVFIESSTGERIEQGREDICPFLPHQGDSDFYIEFSVTTNTPNPQPEYMFVTSTGSIIEHYTVVAQVR